MSATAPHIYTLTGNLLAERTLEVPEWTPGGTHRAQRETFQVGGKGINVSKMLSRLAVPNTALCFVGGASGSECETWLQERRFQIRTFTTSQPTRQGTVVRSPNQRETTFLGTDVSPDRSALEACAAFLDAQPAGNVLALCGSFPGWADERFAVLRDAFARWLSRGPVVADTYGPPLAWVAQQPVELLKVNASELRTIGLSAEKKVPIAARRYVITDGPNPVRIHEMRRGGTASSTFGDDETTVTPPVVQEISPTGSGDVMLACLIDALFRRQKTLREAVIFALPYAAANAAHHGVAEFPNPS